MVIREIVLDSINENIATEMVRKKFESRGLGLVVDKREGVLRFDRFYGHSSIAFGTGQIAVAPAGEFTRIRFGIQLSLSTTGSILFVVSILAFVAGIVVFWILRDAACLGVIRELDRA